jgi:hypothetical protein
MLSKRAIEKMAGKPVDRKPSKVGYAIGSTFYALFVAWAVTWLLDRFLYYTYLHPGIMPHIPSTIDELLGFSIPLLGGFHPIELVYKIIFLIVFVWVMRRRGHWRKAVLDRNSS